MGDVGKSKVARGRRKTTVTRLLGTIERLIAEKNVKLVKSNLAKVNAAFDDLDTSHDSYNDLLEDEQLLNESEIWFQNAQQEYVTRIKPVLDWLMLHDSATQDSDNVNSKSSVNVSSQGVSTHADNDEGLSTSEFANLLAMPKVGMDKFDGNPANYQNFMALFDESFGTLSDDQVKLTRLLFYTTGAAKLAIKDTILIGGSQGYQQARKLLHDRFGNPHLVSQRIMKDLKCGKSVRKPHELEQLADQLSVALTTLTKLDMLGEINTQESIIQILERCPDNVRSQWIKKALRDKRQMGNILNVPILLNLLAKRRQRFVTQFMVQTISSWLNLANQPSAIMSLVNSLLYPRFQVQPTLTLVT